MRRTLTMTARLAAAAVAAITLAVPMQAQSSRPTVALLDLDFGAVQRWWEGNWDIGKGVADLIVDGLVEDGSYRVIERKALDKIMAEQNLAASDRAEPGNETVAKIGRLLKVKYLITGSITKFGTENKNLGVGGGGFGRLGGALGNVGTKKGKATVAITTRVIDTATGEIMASAKGEGESKRTGLMLGGGGAGTGGGGFGGISMGSSDFRETVLGEATEAAVKMVVEKLVAAKGRITNPE
jgi:curli biogenesis system outer membrane secretion channel CsgG